MIYGDDLEAPEALLGPLLPRRARVATTDQAIVRRLLPNEVYSFAPPPWFAFDAGLVAQNAPCSQFDALIPFVRRNEEGPKSIACLALTGEGFHGHHGRGWVTSLGNIHLSLLFRFSRPLPNSGPALVALPAVAVIDVLDDFLGSTRSIDLRWVNDVRIAGAKVAGVLTHTVGCEEGITDVVLGIGVNVETRPSLPACPFVPRVTAVRDHAPNVRLPEASRALLHALQKRIDELVEWGPEPVVNDYRARSAVVGQEIEIHPDRASDGMGVRVARVAGLNERLELLLEGQPEPVRRGRLVLPR